MLIAAYATGARYGYIYCRAEYPLAIKRLKIAIAEAEERKFLGEHILDSGFSFNLSIKEGAGAFVCGEETALMASIQGRRGMPSLRPPFPAESGIHESPTNINNVETYENVAFIINRGPGAFNQYRCGKTVGTKVFALAGKVKRVGLVEIPVGMTIRELVEGIGGGSSTGRPLKAIQMGGPSGGCIPERLFDTTIDVESITATGAIMGSGGIVVMDDQTCMVDVARYFLTFIQNESCGKCTFCRIGTKRMLDILTRFTNGEGADQDLALLEDVARHVKKTSLCGLGQLAPNPVLTTIRYFREEYEAHITEKRCPAKVCKPLIRFTIAADACVGCGTCTKSCPVKAISGEKKALHHIDSRLCTRCGLCRETCTFHAMAVR
jgi:NADH-quinone oxidoreductase subunit F